MLEVEQVSCVRSAVMRLLGCRDGSRMRYEGEHMGGPNTFMRAYIMTTYPILVWIRYKT